MRAIFAIESRFPRQIFFGGISPSPMEKPIKLGIWSAAIPPILYLIVIAATWMFVLHPIWRVAHGYTMDDSYISFRYAENLYRYGRIIWNRAETPPTEGYTSILWVLICAGLKALGANLIEASKWLGTYLILATSLLIAISSRFVAARAPLACGIAALVAFLANRDLVLHMLSGMETAVAIFLSTAFFASLTAINRALTYGDAPPRRMFVLVGLLGVMCALNRPEFNLAFAVGVSILVMLNWPHKRRIFLYLALPYCCIGSAYMLWRLAYYGPILPLPFYIKVSSQHIAGMSDVLSFLMDIWPVVILAMVAMIFRDTRRLLAPVTCAVASILVFFIFPAHIMGVAHRFLVPVYGAVCFMAAAGISRLIAVTNGAAANLAIGVMAAICIAGVYRLSEDPVPGMLFYERGLDGAHVRLGKALHEYGESHTISMGDDGAISYYSGWNVIDSFGLNDRSIARARSRDAYDPELVLGRNPDVLVLISASPSQIKPILPYEANLFSSALAHGYRNIGAIQFAPTYNLFLYAKPSEFSEKLKRDLKEQGILQASAP